MAVLSESDSYLRLIVILDINTGMRIGKLLGLRYNSSLEIARLLDTARNQYPQL